MAISEEKIEEIVGAEICSLWHWVRQSGCSERLEAISANNFFPKGAETSMLPYIEEHILRKTLCS